MGWSFFGFLILFFYLKSKLRLLLLWHMQVLDDFARLRLPVCVCFIFKKFCLIFFFHWMNEWMNLGEEKKRNKPNIHTFVPCIVVNKKIFLFWWLWQSRCQIGDYFPFFIFVDDFHLSFGFSIRNMNFFHQQKCLFEWIFGFGFCWFRLLKYIGLIWFDLIISSFYQVWLSQNQNEKKSSHYNDDVYDYH